MPDHGLKFNSTNSVKKIFAIKRDLNLLEKSIYKIIIITEKTQAKRVK